ncbi:MAG: PAS domain-containing protein [Comamonadaceae bacterium]|nr:PAS domain-containing protein [Comamonadaceae bacterium]
MPASSTPAAPPSSTPAPTYALPRLLRRAATRWGCARDAVDWVIPTHVHLDHAGGAGALMRELPGARCVVHPRGARAPGRPERRSSQGAIGVYGEAEMARCYGEVVAGAGRTRCQTSADGIAASRWPAASLQFADTPGHARHHHCVWDEATRGWFTGDTFGLSLPRVRRARRTAPGCCPPRRRCSSSPTRCARRSDRLLARDPRVHLPDALRPRRRRAARCGAQLLALLDAMVALGRARRGRARPPRRARPTASLAICTATASPTHGCTMARCQRRAAGHGPASSTRRAWRSGSSARREPPARRKRRKPYSRRGDCCRPPAGAHFTRFARRLLQRFVHFLATAGLQAGLRTTDSDAPARGISSMRINLPTVDQEYPFPSGETLVSTTDLKGRITYCNPAFISVSGFRKEDLLGQPHNLIRHPDMPEEAFRDMWRSVTAGQPWSAAVKNRRADGRFYWVMANVTPLMQDGRPVGYMSVRTEPTREEIREAESLYARMRSEKQAGRATAATAGGRALSRDTLGALEAAGPAAAALAHGARRGGAGRRQRGGSAAASAGRRYWRARCSAAPSARRC